VGTGSKVTARERRSIPIKFGEVNEGVRHEMPQEGLELRALPEDREVQVALEFKPGDLESNDENVHMVLWM